LDGDNCYKKYPTIANPFVYDDILALLTYIISEKKPMKIFIVRTFLIMLALTMLTMVVACGGQPSQSSVDTAVAGTVAAMPAGDATQVIEVTQVVDVTRVSVIQYTPTPRPTEPPTDTPEPSDTPTPAPTETPRPPMPGEPTAVITVEPSGEINLTLNQFLNQYKNMTDLQKKEYVATLPGKQVFWTAEVDNVTTDGLVELSNLFSSDSVVLVGVPYETAVKMDKKMLVDFKGMIQSFTGDFSPDIVVVDVTIVRVYNLPTPTPTP